MNNNANSMNEDILCVKVLMGRADKEGSVPIHFHMSDGTCTEILVNKDVLLSRFKGVDIELFTVGKSSEEILAIFTMKKIKAPTSKTDNNYNLRVLLEDTVMEEMGKLPEFTPFGSVPNLRIHKAIVDELLQKFNQNKALDLKTRHPVFDIRKCILEDVVSALVIHKNKEN